MTDIPSKTVSHPTPWRIEHRNVPLADTGDYDGLTQILSADGEEVVQWWNTTDEEEAVAERIVQTMNAHETEGNQAGAAPVGAGFKAPTARGSLPNSLASSESTPISLDRAAETMHRVYLRLQCADVPRAPWHEEVSEWLLSGSPPVSVWQLSDETIAPLTLGKLILDTARGDVKQRTLSPEETRQIWESIGRYFKGPLQFSEPKDDNEFARILDASGNLVAHLFWPGHPADETEAAEQATYALGRAMAAAGSALKASVRTPNIAKEP